MDASTTKARHPPPSSLAMQHHHHHHHQHPGAGNDDSEELCSHPCRPFPTTELWDDVDYAAMGENADLFEQYHALYKELGMLDRKEQELRTEVADLIDRDRLLQNLCALMYDDGRCDGALIAGSLVELVDDRHAIVDIDVTTDGDPLKLYVPVLEGVDSSLLKPGANVALCMWAHAVVAVLPADASAACTGGVPLAERPSATYADVAGLEDQKRELLEAVELPLTHPELFDAVGVDPPRGVLLHGPPGTGKTMLARAVAHHTSAAFFRLSGSELVRRHLGEGPRMVREVFRAARDSAPAIIFFDEVDAIAASRTDSDECSAADREVHRVLLELLTQMDGFEQCSGVSVIMATNRADALDPALLRPGRLDRLVEFPLPGTTQRRLLYQSCTAGMSLDGDVDLEELVGRRDRMSAAEIDAVCREAAMRAVRDGRFVVTRKDFYDGYRAVAKDMKHGAHEFSFYS